MTTRPHPLAQNVLQSTRRFLRRLLGGKAAQERVDDESGSYVGLFHGVIETDAPAATAGSPVPVHRPSKPSTRAAGFLRLDVNDKKKATGCFLFFVDGKILSGAIEGASEQTGFVEASFRLDAQRAHGAEGAAPSPVAAVGRLHLETRHPRGAAAPGENLTIRFV